MVLLTGITLSGVTLLVLHRFSVAAAVVGLVVGCAASYLIATLVPIKRKAAKMRDTCSAPLYTVLGKIVTAFVTDAIIIPVTALAVSLVMICVTAASMNGRIIDADDDLSSAKVDLGSATMELADTKSGLETAIALAIKDRQAEMEDMQMSYDELVAESDYNTLLGEAEGLAQRLEVVKGGGDEMKIRIAQDDYDSKKAMLDSVEVRLQEKLDKISSLQASIDRTTEQMNKDMEGNIAELQAKIDVLQASVDDKAAIVASQKDDLNAMRSRIAGYAALVELIANVVCFAVIYIVLTVKPDLAKT